jgi:hypothetical protein
MDYANKLPPTDEATLLYGFPFVNAVEDEWECPESPTHKKKRVVAVLLFKEMEKSWPHKYILSFVSFSLILLSYQLLHPS